MRPSPQPRLTEELTVIWLFKSQHPAETVHPSVHVFVTGGRQQVGAVMGLVFCPQGEQVLLGGAGQLAENLLAVYQVDAPYLLLQGGVSVVVQRGARSREALRSRRLVQHEITAAPFLKKKHTMRSKLFLFHCGHPSKHDTLNQCRFNVGPTL